MKTIIVPGDEFWDDENQMFIYGEETTIKLEHSLVSLYKWESKHKKHYLDNNTLTQEEQFDYIRCMVVTQNVSEDVFKRFSRENVKEILEYINDPMTAATFVQDPNFHGIKRSNGEFITSETIYYWMTQLQIPFSCEKWNLNRLMALIKYCNLKNTPPKKMSQKDLYARNKAINARNRAKYKSKG